MSFKKLKTKGAPPEAKKTENLNVAASGNGNASDNFVAMNFKVNPEFRKDFRSYASDLDIPMKDLLERCFAFYKERH